MIPVILGVSVCQQGLYLTKTTGTPVGQTSTEQCGPGLRVSVLYPITVTKWIQKKAQILEKNNMQIAM